LLTAAQTHSTVAKIDGPLANPRGKIGDVFIRQQQLYGREVARQLRLCEDRVHFVVAGPVHDD